MIQHVYLDSGRVEITIPDNPTNGDMVKALFPNYDYDCEDSDVRLMDYCCILCHFPEWWWNSPYKKETNNDK